MASRNLNYPQSYGTGIVHIPFRVRVDTDPPVGDVTISNETPSDGYSVTFSSLGVSSGSISITTVDSFSDVISAQFTEYTSSGTVMLNAEGIFQLPDGRWRFNVRQYTFAGGAPPTQGYHDGTIHGLLIMRNSSVRF